MFDTVLDDPVEDLDPAVVFGWPLSLEEAVAGSAGLELAAALAAAGDPATVSDWTLVELIKGFDKQVAHAQAAQALAIAELAARRPGLGPIRGVSAFAADEVAAALGLSRRAGEDRLGEAVVWARSLRGTLAALHRGDITLTIARVLAAETVTLDDAQCAAVEATVLPRVGGRTPAQVRSITRRAVLAVDPAAATARHEAAVAGRGVTLEPRPEGMADLRAHLPAPDAVTVFDTLDAIAFAATGPGDPRGVDARRAEVLVAVFTALRDTGTATCQVSGTTRPAGRPAPTRRRRRARADVIVAATTLLGLDELPGELPGYGPIPAELARRLADHATWRRILTDPATGAVLDVGRTRYRPPAGLDSHVRTRDQRCTFPGCRVPATICDLDHTVAYPAGPTADHNLGPDCRHHHRGKHEAGWTAVQTEPGTFTWTLPTGHTYTTQPPPLPGTPEWAGPPGRPPDDEVPPYWAGARPSGAPPGVVRMKR